MKLKVVIVDLEMSTRAKKWAFRVGVPVALLLGGSAIARAGADAGTFQAFEAGTKLTASQLNGDFAALQGQLSMLQGQTTLLQGQVATLQSQSGQTSSTSVELATDQVVAGGASANLSFSNVAFDLANEFNGTTGSFTPKNAGYYLIDCGVSVSAPNTSVVNLSICSGSCGAPLSTSVIYLPAGAQNEIETVAMANLSADSTVVCNASIITTGSSVTVLGAASYNAQRSRFIATRLF